MTQQELLDYLSAASDAENSVYTCEQVIQSLEQRITSLQSTIIPIPEKPTKPKHEDPNAERCPTDEYVDQLIPDNGISVQIKTSTGLVPFFIIFIVGSIIGSALILSMHFWLGFLCDCGALVFALFAAYTSRKNMRRKKLIEAKHQIYRQRLETADQRYGAKLEQYEQNMAAFQEKEAACQYALKQKDDCIHVIRSEISQLRDKVLHLDQLRQEVYSRNVLHVNFRNMVAVNQLREYVEMGICSTLEGPEGAYAEYLKDLRTNRIVGSIDAMHATMTNQFGKLAEAMGNVVNEVRFTRSSIDNMNYSLSNAIGNLTSMHAATHDQLRAYQSQSQQQLTQIGNTLATAAHNQYVALRETNVREYLQAP